MKIIKQPLIMFFMLMFVLSCTFSVAAIELKNYRVVAENEYLTLFINETTTEVAVYDHSTDQFWFTNPPERNSVETIARGAAKEALGAQINITYYTPTNVQRTMNNYNDSIVYDQFEITEIDNGVRVDYVLGKEWDDQYFLPLVVEKSIFEEQFLPLLSTAQARTISGFYALMEVNEPSEGESTNLLSKYNLAAVNNDLTTRERNSIHNVLIAHVTKYTNSLESVRDIQTEHIEAFLGKQFYILKQREQDMLPWDKEGIIDIAREVGFDPYIIGEGYQLFNLDPPEPNIVLFEVPIEYKLDGSNLLARIPTEDIYYPNRILDSTGQRVTYPLTQISLLPYFGAAETGADGYMLIPDGSGAIMNFDNRKIHLTAYGRRVYDQDYAVSVPTTNVSTHQINLPVFGIKNSDSALFAIIEDGASIARISADVAGRRISYNTINPSFHVIERTTASLQASMPDSTYGASAQWVIGGGGTVNVYQESMYAGDIQVRYAFLNDNQADYVGMAHYYQEYLEQNGVLKRVKSNENVPLIVEFIGSVEDRRPILGVPRSVMVPLTTYQEAETLVTDIVDRGIDNLSVIYTGWMKNGVSHLYPTKVRLESSLGTKADLLKLTESALNQGVRFYPTVNFMHVHSDTWGDGFSSTRDASRNLTRNITVGTNPNNDELNYYVTSPAKINDLVDRYLNSQKEYNFQGIHLSDLADRLYGDYRSKRVLIREEAIGIIQNQLQKMVEDYDLDLLANGINAYSLPYVSDVVNLPLYQSGVDIMDDKVPFLQIVLHGYVNYAGEPLNRAASPSDYFLKMIETGAYPYFQMFNEDPSILKGSFYDFYFTGQYNNVIDEALEVYHTFNQVFQGLQDQRIVGHQKLDDDVFETTYENGTSVIVNYSDEAIMVANNIVEAQNFIVLKRSDQDE